LRANDDRPLLTWEQELVLSALPAAHATDAVQIKRRVTLQKETIKAALQHLVSAGLAEAAGEFNSAALFRATSEGVNHWQKRPAVAVSDPPRMPVYSSRVQGMLSAIHEGGALRVKDVKAALGWTFQATNALIQYLKRKGLIEKSDDAFEAPYMLTAMGSLTLAEMTSPGQMRRGYAPGSNKADRTAKTPALKNVEPGRKNARLARRERARTPPPVKQPRIPVTSERVRAVLTIISSSGALRIKDISDNLCLPNQTINALIQNLKRRGLVEKTAEGLGSPFQLTVSGRAVLAQMEQRRVA
jgi:predicted transcriptional regulator